jgi:hypothetical protein
MGKRKSTSGDLPPTIELQPADDASTSERTGAFAVYFPSGFQPGKHGNCCWEVHKGTVCRNDHIIVARMVGKSRHIALAAASQKRLAKQVCVDLSRQQVCTARSQICSSFAMKHLERA